MPTAGGLLGKSEHIPKHGNKHSAYQEVGEGKFIIMPNGMKMAREHKKGDVIPEGYCVIHIEYGNDNTEMGPVPVTNGEDTVVIPRGSDRLVSLNHVNVLNDAITTDYFQRDLMSGLESRSSRRFNFSIKEWPKTGDAKGVPIEVLDDAKERHEVIDLNQD
mgnify:FL=1|tara:strand:- start:1710 stop:2192 length:483 start_codon:yes stop_codon:yes gene_type:complete